MARALAAAVLAAAVFVVRAAAGEGGAAGVSVVAGL